MIITLPFDTLVLNTITDPSDRLELASMDQFDNADTVGIEVRPMASGRLRAFRSNNRKRQFNIACTLASPTETAWLTAHIGVHLCLRAPFITGRMFGLYAAVNTTPYPGNNMTDLNLQLLEVSHSEAV